MKDWRFVFQRLPSPFRHSVNKEQRENEYQGNRHNNETGARSDRNQHNGQNEHCHRADDEREQPAPARAVMRRRQIKELVPRRQLVGRVKEFHTMILAHHALTVAK